MSKKIPRDKPIVKSVELDDVYGEFDTSGASIGRHNIKATVRITSRYILISFEGYGDLRSSKGHGEPVLIENRDGVPRVVVWGDINQEYPTDDISLEGAAEYLRKEANK